MWHELIWVGEELGIEHHSLLSGEEGSVHGKPKHWIEHRLEERHAHAHLRRHLHLHRSLRVREEALRLLREVRHIIVFDWHGILQTETISTCINPRTTLVRTCFGT